MKHFFTKALVFFAFFGTQYINSNGQDAGVSNILSPVNLSCGSSAGVVAVIISNYGTSSISTVPVTAKITGSSSFTLIDTLKKTVAAGQQDTLIFKTTINIYSGGTFKYVVYTILSGDGDRTNDTLKTSITSLPFPSVPTIPTLGLCGAGLANFVATSTSKGSKTYWYATDTSIPTIAIGDTLKKTISSTTTYYAASVQGLGSHYLTTTMVAGNGQVGNMFDVHVKNTINIDSFDVNPGFSGNDSLVFYYRLGTYSGYNNTAAAWTYVGTAYIKASSGSKTRAVFKNRITLSAGQSYGFCLYSYGSNTMNYTNGSSTYTDSFYNSDLIAYAGIGIGAALPTTSTFSPRIWNGTIYYSTPTCSSKRVAVTYTVKAPVKSLALSKDASSKGNFNAGTLTSPDQVCVGDSLKYDLGVPKNFTNSDYGTKWSVTYTLKSLSGQSLTNYAVKTPSSTASGLFAFAPVKANLDSTYELIVDADNIVSGCDSLFVRYIHVNSVVVPGFTVSTNVCFGKPVTINSTATPSGKVSSLWNMGDGNGISGNSQTYLYASPGTFTITQTAYNAGCGASTSKSVTIYVSPIGSGFGKGAPFNGKFNDGEQVNPDYACLRDTNTYVIIPPKGSSSSNYGSVWVITSVSMKTSSGYGPKSKDTAITFPKSGKNLTFRFSPTTNADSLYDIRIRIKTLSGGCDSTIERYVKVMVKPTVAFTFTNSCQGYPLTFSGTSTIAYFSSIANYAWNFGDGITDSVKGTKHSYAKAGFYKTTLTTTSTEGCSASLTQTVQQYPVPDIKFGEIASCSRYSTKFMDSSSISSGSISVWSWSFGDGFLATIKSPGHIYAKSGTFTVRLSETSVLGCSDSLTKKITVLASPVAAFTYRAACVGSPIITANNSTDPSGVSKYLWNFGDGSTSTSTKPLHTYALNGTYSAYLSVSSTNGCADTDKQTITPFAEPQVYLNLPNTCAGTAASLIDTGSSGSNYTYIWNFGDGAVDTLSTNTAAHNYSNANTYKVSLMVQNSNGCFDSTSSNINVLAFPVAAFTTANVCLNKPAIFNNASTGGSLTYKWDFGDTSGIVTTANSAHIYKKPGSYPIKLTATNGGSCADSIVKTIIINPLPVIAPWVRQQNKYTVSFVPADTNIGQFKWYFGDPANDSSSVKKPTFMYPATDGKYQVKLFVTSKAGCVAIRTDSIFTGKYNGIEKINTGLGIITVYPNPFDGIVHINYNLGSPGALRIAIYDLTGKQVAELKNGAFEAGQYSDVFNADKYHCARGMYILKMVVNSEVYTMKIENMK